MFDPRPLVALLVLVAGCSSTASSGSEDAPPAPPFTIRIDQMAVGVQPIGSTCVLPGTLPSGASGATGLGVDANGDATAWVEETTPEPALLRVRAILGKDVSAPKGILTQRDYDAAFAAARRDDRFDVLIDGTTYRVVVHGLGTDSACPEWMPRPPWDG